MLSIVRTTVWMIVLWIIVGLCLQPAIALQRQSFGNSHLHISLNALCALFLTQMAIFWLSWLLIVFCYKKLLLRTPVGTIFTNENQKLVRKLFQRLHTEVELQIFRFLWGRGLLTLSQSQCYIVHEYWYQ